ncbi:aminoglycoside phosphotransferase family protein [Bacillus horti]|uniref:Hygromycin-B 7''-O-kinase n=2 Tax=Caldalkalibacillus horti TaxID=77523 RepID=A0ABT9VZ18_9BACI|nr:hygromycin-B 7''-O-kinase [Bacillus horti]
MKRDTYSIVNKILDKYSLPQQTLTKFETGTTDVFAYGEDLVIKTYFPEEADERLIEVAVLKHLNQCPLPIRVPSIVNHGVMEDVPYLIMTRVPGYNLDDYRKGLTYDNMRKLLVQIGETMKNVHQIPKETLPDIYLEWSVFMTQQMDNCVAHHRKLGLKEELLRDIPSYIEKYKHLLPTDIQPVLLTGEYTPFNLLVEQQVDGVSLTGMIDFADCMVGFHEYDLLGPAVFFACGNPELLQDLLFAYGYTQDKLDEPLRKRLMLLLLLHRYSDLNVLIQIENWQEKVSSVEELEHLLWCF